MTTSRYSFDLARIGAAAGYGIKIYDSYSYQNSDLLINIQFQNSKGDFNHDGLNDLFFTGYSASANYPVVYTIYGNKNFTQPVFDLENLTPDIGFGVVIDEFNSAACIGSGRIDRVDSGFDYNHDGIDDLYVSAVCGTDSLAVFLLGFIIYGRVAPFPSKLVFLSDLPTSYYTSSEYNAIACGDVNGDGFGDLLGIGSSAPSSPGSGLCSTNFKFILGQGSSQILHFNVACAYASNGWFRMAATRLGDVNGDNISDVVVADRYATENLVHQAGIAYVIYGNKTLNAFNNLFINDINPYQGYMIYGYKINQQCANKLDYIGDINNDHINDISLTCNDGSIFVVYGQKGDSIVAINLNTINSQTGLYGDSSLGFTLPFGGIDSFTGGNFSSFIYPSSFLSTFPIIIEGQPSYTTPFNLNSVNSVQLSDSSSRGFYNGDSHTIGDFNGDGFDDVVLSVLRNTVSQHEAIYILFGNSTLPSTPAPTSTVTPTPAQAPGQESFIESPSGIITIVGSLVGGAIVIAAAVYKGYTLWHSSKHVSSKEQAAAMELAGKFGAAAVASAAVTNPLLVSALEVKDNILDKLNEISSFYLFDDPSELENDCTNASNNSKALCEFWQNVDPHVL